jgi:hypothetical protein
MLHPRAMGCRAAFVLSGLLEWSDNEATVRNIWEVG